MANNALVQQQRKGELTAAERSASPITSTPRCDIAETPDELILYADLPGVQPGDVDIRFEKGELVIEGKCTPRHRGTDFLACEYGVGDFYRAFSINEQVNADRITAEF